MAVGADWCRLVKKLGTTVLEFSLKPKPLFCQEISSKDRIRHKASHTYSNCMGKCAIHATDAVTSMIHCKNRGHTADNC